MSFTERIIAKDLPKYQVVNNWATFFQGLLQQPNPVRSLGGSLQVHKKIFTGPISFLSNSVSGLRFVDCYFTDDVLFYDSVWDVPLSFNQCFFDKRLTINGRLTKFNSELNFIEVAVGIQILVIAGTFSDCKWTFNENTTIKISGGIFDQLNIGAWGGGNMKYLLFDLRKVKGHLTVSGAETKIEELNIFQFSSEVSIAIEDININCLSIYRYRNEKGLRISNVKSLKIEKMPTEFTIVESYLGKTEFTSLDFNEFENVNILDSHIVDCSFVNIDWKYRIRSFKGRRVFRSENDLQLEQKILKIEDPENMGDAETEGIKSEQEVINYYRKNREIYRQIKFALSKQGDVINEQKFHSREMRAYDKTLHGIDSLGTKIIIAFSYCFSDFGQSIARPFWFLLLGHWILFMVLIGMGHFDSLTISIDHPTYEGFKSGLESFLKLINPLRRDDEGFSGYATLIDILMRVWSSYMIYNIIRATRRFIK